MADQIDFNLIRVADGDNDPEALATAYFYRVGTSTPLTVYADQGLTTPYGISLASDANGIFAPAYTDGSVGVKVVVKDSSGATVPGYPLDPARSVQITATGAASVSIVPFTGVASTNVQAALEEIQGNITAVSENIQTLVLTGGSSNAYTLVAAEPITAYAAGQRFLIRPNFTNTGACTLNIGGLGAKNIKIYNSSGAITDPTAGAIYAHRIYEVVYDGTRFVLITDSMYGLPKTVTDWNDATVPGVYVAVGGASNAPSAHAYSGFVFGTATSTVISQIVFRHGVNSLWVRNFASSVWSPWEEIAHSGNIASLLNASGAAPVYAPRAWVNFTGTGTVAIKASGNVSSITDNGVGDYTVNFTTAMADTSYGVSVTVERADLNTNGTPSGYVRNGGVATGSVRIITCHSAANTVDYPSVYVAIHR